MQKIDVPMNQRNFGHLSRQSDVSVISVALEAACSAHPAYSGNIFSPQAFDRVEE